ncbi:MAG: tRNA lysidine(34) synthetase TilS [Pseudomonadota bacterium]
MPEEALPTWFSGFDFSKTEKVLLALSGGGDSTALLHLFYSHWTGELGRDASTLFAATVDHGVRDGAAQEAAAVAQWCGGLGINHRKLTWHGGSVTTGFQSAARNARYKALADCAAQLGVRLVLTGHTLDDQKETLLMRAKRSSAGPGMAGIAPATLYERQIWFARPLLGVSRAALRDYLNRHDQPWFDDPSNADVRYERVRVRQGGDDPFGNGQLDNADAASERQRTAIEAARWLARAVHLETDEGGRFCALLAMPDLAHEDGFVGLSYLLMLVGMQTHLPERASIAGALDVLTNTGRSAFTVAGCLLERDGASVRVAPESRNRRESGFGLDHLLPIWELPVLDALDRLRGLEKVTRPLFCRFD